VDVFAQPLVMVYAFAFAWGAVVGSFLNVLVYRLPREISVVKTPPSSCPACSTPIRWFDNIPLISWIILRGRCRRCQAPISIRYPLVELTAGLLAVAAVARWGLSVTGLEVLTFAWVSLALGLVDLDYQILPNVLTYPSNKLWRGIEGMGWGDVKYLAAIGAVVGLRGVVGILVVASILGALVGLALIASGRGSGKTALPFGTFLALAVILWLYAPASWLALSPL
jgi:leader peptidase (prepilin peptidase)/N-methyltransferase